MNRVLLVYRRLKDFTVHLIFEHTTVFFVIALIITISAFTVFIVKAKTIMINSFAVKNGKIYTDTLIEFRELYTKNVVLPAMKSGMKITHNPHGEAHSIPLPATLSLMLGERLSQKPGEKNLKTSLYSKYPFPWREKSGGLSDSFKHKAWEHLKENPEEPFYTLRHSGTNPQLRFAVADIMKPSCVNCHNQHPNSPKRDWKVGDLRGVLEIRYPLDLALAELDKLFTLFYLFVFIVGFTLVFALRQLMYNTRNSYYQSRLLNSKLNLVNERLSQRNLELIDSKKNSDLTNVSLMQRTQELQKSQLATLNILEDLELAKQEAEQANNTKSIFLANMSHEMRTPLTGIIGFSEMLKRIDSQKKRDEFVSIIQDESHNLLILIDRILEQARLGTGKIYIEKSPFHIDDLFNHFNKEMKVLASKKGLIFELELNENLDNHVIADRDHIRQVLTNLCSNSIKFTHTGKVLLEVKKVFAHHKTLFRFRITDTGIGIAKEDLRKIFEPFYQTDSSLSKNYGGAGLGITIAKQLVELMDGDIQVDSELGLGTTFTIEIPYEINDDPLAPSKEPQKENEGFIRFTHSPKILIVDDYETNLNTMSSILEMANCICTTCHSGIQAIDVANGTEFDIILMDFQMPGMSGLETTVKLREMNVTQPIIGLTARLDSDLSANSSEFNQILYKPIQPAKLLQVIKSWLPEKQYESVDIGSNIDKKYEKNTVMDWQRFYNDLMANHNIIQRVVDKFIKEFSGKLEKAEELISIQELDEIPRLCHGLLGCCSNFYTARLSQIIKDLSQASKNKDVQSCRSQLESLKQEFKIVEEFITFQTQDLVRT